MCCVRLPGGGTATYAWGRGDDGQLGSGDRRDRRANPRVAATAARVNSVGQRPLRGLACGWAHTGFVVDAPPSSLLETPPRALLPRTPPAPGLRAPGARRPGIGRPGGPGARPGPPDSFFAHRAN